MIRLYLLRRPLFVSIVSVYAHTHRDSQEDKDDGLQSVVDGISEDDLLLIVGDFNARVGCDVRGDPWNGVHGSHDVGYVNTSGEA